MFRKIAVLAFALAPMSAMAAGNGVPPTGPAPMGNPYMDHQGQEGHGPGRGGPGGRRSPDEMFERMDANHDGVVTKAEFDQARQRMMERRMERREGGRGGPGMNGQHDGPPGMPQQR